MTKPVVLVGEGGRGIPLAFVALSYSTLPKSSTDPENSNLDYPLLFKYGKTISKFER
jgi:hypothetical protein